MALPAGAAPAVKKREAIARVEQGEGLDALRRSGLEADQAEAALQLQTHLGVAVGMAGPGVDLRGAVAPRRLADHRIVIHLQHGFEIVKPQTAELGHGCNPSASDCRAAPG
jgi:hypothetical protein